MSPEVLRVHSSDGAETDATVFTIADARAPVVLIVPAMGVPARFYVPLAESLVRRGLHAVTVDLRGIGSSNRRASRRTDFGYAEMVESDLPAAVTVVRARFPHSPLWLLGHSLGGQLSALYLARNPDAAQGLLLVASASIHYKTWPANGRWGLLAFSQFFALIASVLGYLPGKRLGFGGLEAKTVIHDWARLGRRGVFAPSGSSFDYEAALRALARPVLGLSLAGDLYAPRAGMAALLGKMPSAQVEHRHLDADDLGGKRLDHFNWVKSPDALVALMAQRVRPTT